MPLIQTDSDGCYVSLVQGDTKTKIVAISDNPLDRVRVQGSRGVSAALREAVTEHVHSPAENGQSFDRLRRRRRACMSRGMKTPTMASGVVGTMKFTYRLIREATAWWFAECVESDAVGEGKTAPEAVESLRASIEDRMFRPDAVAVSQRAGDRVAIVRRVVSTPLHARGPSLRMQP